MPIYYELFLDETGDFSGLNKNKSTKSANVGFLIKTVSEGNSGFFSNFVSDENRVIEFSAKLDSGHRLIRNFFEAMCKSSFNVLMTDLRNSVLEKENKDEQILKAKVPSGYCFTNKFEFDQKRKMCSVVIDHWGGTMKDEAGNEISLSDKARSYLQPVYLKGFIDLLNKTFSDNWKFVIFHSKQREQLSIENSSKTPAINALYFVNSFIDGIVQLWYSLYKEHEIKHEKFYLNVFVAKRIIKYDIDNKTMKDKTIKNKGILKKDLWNKDKIEAKLLQLQNLLGIECSHKVINDFHNCCQLEIFGGYSRPSDNETKVTNYEKAYCKAYNALIKDTVFEGENNFSKHILLTVADNFANSYRHCVEEKEKIERNKLSYKTSNYYKIFQEELIDKNKIFIFKTNIDYDSIYNQVLKVVLMDNSEGSFEEWVKKYDEGFKRNLKGMTILWSIEKLRNDFAKEVVYYFKTMIPANRDKTNRQKYLHMIEHLANAFRNYYQTVDVTKAMALFMLDLDLFKAHLYQNLGRVSDANNLLDTIKKDVKELTNSEEYIDRHIIFTLLRMNGLNDKFCDDMVASEYKKLKKRLNKAQSEKNALISIVKGEAVFTRDGIFTPDIGKVNNIYIESRIISEIKNNFKLETEEVNRERQAANRYAGYKKIYEDSLTCFPKFNDREYTYSHFIRLAGTFENQHRALEKILLASLIPELEEWAKPGKGNWRIRKTFDEVKCKIEKDGVIETGKKTFLLNDIVREGLYDSSGNLRLFVLLNYLTVLRKLLQYEDAKYSKDYDLLLDALKTAEVTLNDDKLPAYPLCLIYWRIAELAQLADEKKRELNIHYRSVIEAITFDGDNAKKDAINLLDRSVALLDTMGANTNNLRIMTIKIAVLAYKIYFLKKSDGRYDTAISTFRSAYKQYVQGILKQSGNRNEGLNNLFEQIKVTYQSDGDIMRHSYDLAKCVPDYY